jgi:hypothetical protein
MMDGKILLMSFKRMVWHLLKDRSELLFLIIFLLEIKYLFADFFKTCRFGGRLISIIENKKFRATGDVTESGTPDSLKDFVLDIKSTFGLK